MEAAIEEAKVIRLFPSLGWVDNISSSSTFFIEYMSLGRENSFKYKDLQALELRHPICFFNFRRTDLFTRNLDDRGGTHDQEVFPIAFGGGGCTGSTS